MCLPSFQVPPEHIEGQSELNCEIFLNQPGAIERMILLIIQGDFHVLPSKGQAYHPIEFRWPYLVTGLAVGKHVDISKQDHPVLIEIEVRVDHITIECPSGVVGSRKEIVIVKQPSA